MNSILPLGAHCNITFALQNLKLKKETSLFEWFQSDSLATITKVVKAIHQRIDPGLVKGINKNIHLLTPDSDLFSHHYSVLEYRPIFQRRAKRFLDTVKQSKRLLCIRLNPDDRTTSLKEIRDFLSIIKEINPTVSCTFLLISIVPIAETFIPMELDGLVHKYFLERDHNDKYMQNEPVFNAALLSYLVELDWPLETVEREFTDKS
jgi:hypothetical protein